jgi:hypothetical protein
MLRFLIEGEDEVIYAKVISYSAGLAIVLAFVGLLSVGRRVTENVIHPAAQPVTAWLLRLVGFVLSTVVVTGLLTAAAQAGGI